VEEEVPGVRPLSFVDDISFTTRGNSVRELCEKLQKASEAAIEWGHRNDVEFDAAKTEALLFTRKRGRELREQVRQARIVVGEKEVEFAQEATRWLGVWLDSGLTLKTHHQTRLGKARKAEGKAWHRVWYGGSRWQRYKLWRCTERNSGGAVKKTDKENSNY
jgi:hypothetical protein